MKLPTIALIMVTIALFVSGCNKEITTDTTIIAETVNITITAEVLAELKAEAGITALP